MCCVCAPWITLGTLVMMNINTGLLTSHFRAVNTLQYPIGVVLCA